MEHERSSQNHEHQNQFGESESQGLSASPPAFSLTAGDSVAQRQEVTDTTQPDPFADLTDDHRNPLRNSNTSQQNLILLIEEWEANDSTSDDRKLSHILATAMLESGETFQSINENLDMGYFPEHYAPTGYWGRGFVQLTWENNYEDMGDEIGFDLEDNRAAAILPTISAYTTANGMIDGDFTGRALNDYLPVTTNDEGEQEQGQADWFNARRVVNGIRNDPNHFSHQAATHISEVAQALYADITRYRAGIADESISSDTTLASWLYTETNNFDSYKDSDALRIVEALGYMDFQTPNMSNGTDMQQQYQTEVGAAGYGAALRSINRDTERAAIRAFQVAFNQNHRLVTPLPETGQVDARTHEMMMLGGNRIAAGNTMINAAFDGQVQATNLYTQALTNYQAGTLGMNAFALEIASYMPAQNVADVTGIFDQLGGSALSFAFTLARAGHTHDRLAVMNAEVLARMAALLGASDNAAHQEQLTRVNAVINYTPPGADTSGEYIIHTVAQGEYLSTIAQQYGMSYQELGELNNIPPPYNAISVGQELRVPNPDYDPNAVVEEDAPQPASTIAPLTADSPDTSIENNGSATETDTGSNTETPSPESSTTAPEQGDGMGGALQRAWRGVTDFLSTLGD